MKKTRKTAAVLAAVMCLGAAGLAGCSGGQEGAPVQSGGSPSEFTYWCGIPSTAVGTVKDMSEMLMYQELEKRTGVKIKFIHPVANQGNEQFNLLIASRDFPDMMEYNWNNYSGGPDQAIDDNVIIQLNDIMEKNAPSLTRQLRENADYDRQSKTDNGYYYGFPSLNVDQYRCFGGLLLRKDWLDDLGLSIPETVDEWETVLRAFRDQKGATAPFTEQARMFQMNVDNLHTFNTGFDTGKGFYLEEGRVKFAMFDQGYRDWIERLRKWYEEGLLDRDYSTNNATGIDAKMTGGESGACFGYVGSTIGKYMAAMKDKDPGYALAAVPYPVREKGGRARFAELQPEANTPFLTITTACKNPEAAAQWIDYLYSDAGNLLKNFGLEGDTYTLENGLPKYTDKILHNPEGLSASEAMAKYFRANTPAPGFNQSNNYLDQYYQLEEQKEAIQIWNRDMDYVKKTMMPPVTKTLEESEELSNILTELRTYSEEIILKFVKGEEPMENWDTFLQNLRGLQAERAVELQQNAVDRYLGRK